MLRLDLKDNDDTVLFVDPVNGIEIHKIAERLFSVGEQEKYGLRMAFATCASCELMQPVAWYPDPKSRDAAYDYVLTEIAKYLFPPVELGPICQNDAAMSDEVVRL